MEGLPNIFDAVAHRPSGATPRRLLLATQEDKIAGFHLPAINAFPRLCVSITYISTARRHVRHAGGQTIDTMLAMVCSCRKKRPARQAG